MANIKLEYAASSALTITLASLAQSSTLVVGRESDAVDNSSNKYTDYLLAGQLTTGGTATLASTIQVCVIGMMDDSTWPGTFDGTDSAETISSTYVKQNFCKIAVDITIDASTATAYPFGPVSVAALFGGVCPRKFVVFVTHNTGGNLDSTAGNHAIYVTPVYATIV